MTGANRNAVIEGLGRLDDDSVICAFSDGPWGSGSTWDEVRSTRGWLRPAMFADDFDDGDATGWSGDPAEWEIVPGLEKSDMVYRGIEGGMTLAGMSMWGDYEMSAVLESFTDEAGIVFHCILSRFSSCSPRCFPQRCRSRRQESLSPVRRLPVA